MLGKLKRAVLKEELVELTGNAIDALILNQFVYWSERTRDFDAFLAEEAARAKSEEPADLTHGWIYKSADDLADELMGIASAGTVRRHVKTLVEVGWIDERHNPKYTWDRTLQYRPNITKIQQDLFDLGYALDGYPLQIQFDDSILQNEKCNLQNQGSTNHNGESNLHSEGSNLHRGGAVPEITTEITTETTAEREGANAPQPQQSGFANEILSDDQVTDLDTDRWEDQLLKETIRDIVRAKTHRNARGPRKFQSLEQKRAWREAVAVIKSSNNGTSEQALSELLRRAQVKGRTDMAGLVTWIVGCARNGGEVYTSKGGSNAKSRRTSTAGQGRRGEVYKPTEDEVQRARADARRKLAELRAENSSA
jgi:hypothetical protein